MLTRTVSRRRWAGGKRADAEERRGEKDGDGLRRRGGRLLRLAGVGRKRGAVVGAREGRGGEAREAMGREGEGRFGGVFSHPSVAIGDRWEMRAVHVLSYGCGGCYGGGEDLF